LATSTPAPPTTSPTIASFTASSTTVSASGENVELYWTTSNFVTGDYVTINNVKVGGSSDIQEIIKTTTFTIQACTAAGVCGSSRSLAITYAPPGVPTITSLYGSNQSATTTEPPGVYNNVFLWSGGSFTLNWTSANASSVRIFLNSDLDHYMTEKTNGSIASLQYINPATDYAEACSATSCGSPISLNVLIIPSLVFSVNPSQITAGSKSTLSWSSYLDSAGAPGVYTNFTATTNGKTTTSTGSAASGTATYAYSSTTAYSVQACYIDPQNNYEPICSMVKTATITVK
jgi:hypothetical protein